MATAARSLLAAADELVAELRGIAPREDRLRIGVMLDGLGSATAPLLRDFRVAHPDVALDVRRLHADRIISTLLDGTIDAAFMHGPVLDERLEMRPLFTEPASRRSPPPGSSRTPRS